VALAFDAGVQSQNAFVGIIIAALSMAARAALAVWEERLDLVVGLWRIVSPWVLRFSGTTPMRVDLAIGIVVAVLAPIEHWMTAQTLPRRAAGR
jgi:hypothetical protein